MNNYNDTVNYLYSLQKHGIKLGLANTAELMNILGRPHRSFHSVHIAGTNGKGSTAHAISSVLAENGLKVGLFTSPHLVSFTERIQINNQRVTEPEVIDLASEIRRLISGTDLKPTFFEFVTAMAFYYFALNKVDWAVVETGMGGRLDATNVLTPEVSVITNISHDHCEFLGNTVSDIAYEKSGIIKRSIPVVTACRTPEALKTLLETADRLGAEVHIFNREFTGRITRMNDRHLTLDYEGYGNHKDVTIPLTGEYQLYNICLAIRVCEILSHRGFEISPDSIKAGLSSISLEGRLEWVSREPPIILDSAHNPEAARSLAASAKMIFHDKNIILVAGIMDDKDLKGILDPIIRVAETVILTQAKYERAASSAKLRETMSALYESLEGNYPGSISSTSTVKEALDLAASLCSKDHVILVSGSFYTTGEVKEVMGCESVLPKLREYR